MAPEGTRADLMETVLELLDKQGEKLAASELLGVLSLCNLLGIVSYLNKGGGSSGGGPNLAAVTSLAQNLASQSDDGKGLDPQQLMGTLMGLVNAKGGGSGGGQKINPATLLALVNMLGDSEQKQKTPEPVEKNRPAPEMNSPTQELTSPVKEQREDR